MAIITEKAVTSYTVRTVDGDYGTVALEVGEHSVSVLAESSFGSFGYHWSSTGLDPVGFLKRISFDYTMLKFRGTDYEVYDQDATEASLKTQIIATRRRRNIEAEDARSLFEEVADVCDARTVNEFKSNMYRSGNLLTAIYENDYSSVEAKLRYDPQCVGFWDSIWLPLMDHLAKNMQGALVVEQS